MARFLISAVGDPFNKEDGKGEKRLRENVPSPKRALPNFSKKEVKEEGQDPVPLVPLQEY